MVEEKKNAQLKDIPIGLDKLEVKVVWSGDLIVIVARISNLEKGISREPLFGVDREQIQQY